MAIIMAYYSWVTAIISLIIIGLSTFASYKKHKITKKLPPGPKGLPIIGNLHMLGDLPHQDFHKLAKKYGPIMHIKLGQIPVIVASSSEYAKLFLKTHDVVFASRPNAEAADIMSYGQKGMSFSKYGSYWRNMRKLCTLELMTNAKIEMFRPMRKEEVSSVISSLKVAAAAGKAVCLSDKMEKLVEDMTYIMVFGSKDDRFNFKAVISESLKLAGSFVIGDYIPCLRGVDLQGLIPRMKAVNKVYDEYMEKIIEEHVQNAKDQQEGHVKDFIDVMLSLIGSNYVGEVHIGRDNIKAIILDILAAGMQTSADAINWTLSELLRNPKVIKQVQEELQNVVGMDRMVEETDLTKLNYLNMVIKETLRLHPVVPILLPHKGTQDMTIEGYYISKEAWVIINAWAIGRDPNVWANAEEFNPNRFIINTDIDVHGRDFQLIPFGSGRRGCPGMQLGLKLVQFVVAQLFHCFNWELPNGMSPCDLDMSEKYGLALSRASPLVSIPTFRLHVKEF